MDRLALSSPEKLMARNGNPATDSRIAIASVAAIRALGLELVPEPKGDNPAHAEIRAATADLSSHPVRKLLALLFSFLPATSSKA